MEDDRVFKFDRFTKAEPTFEDVKREVYEKYNFDPDDEFTQSLGLVFTALVTFICIVNLFKYPHALGLCLLALLPVLGWFLFNAVRQLRSGVRKEDLDNEAQTMYEQALTEFQQSQTDHFQKTIEALKTHCARHNLPLKIHETSYKYYITDKDGVVHKHTPWLF